MVVVHKTYAKARGIGRKVAAAGMIAFGFALVLLTPSSKHLNPFDHALGDGGVANADAVSCASCDACDQCASLESADCADAGGGGDDGSV